MKSVLGYVTILALVVSTLGVAAVRGGEALYVGGSISSVPEKTEGKLNLEGKESARFTAKKGEFEMPFAKISALEYGQKVGRRVGAAVVVNPAFLLSKKRKHYLTVAFEDKAGVKQSAVFEVSKGSVRSIVGALETNSGKKVEFESDEARKHFEKQK